MTEAAPDPLATRIEQIESSYEFMLAYAAQGREREEGGPGPGIRSVLDTLDEALDGLADAARERGSDLDGPRRSVVTEFSDILDRDAAAARAAVRLTLAHPSIASQLVDNLNGSIHLRAVLTDLFLLDEATRGQTPVSA